jgi:DNA-binding NarL/FixJ family response regulator/HD superfamily phosphohydrolase YqeK
MTDSTYLSSKSPLPPASILIVDDHGIVRDGISALLGREDGLEVVGLAATGKQAVLIAERLRPDVVIMDLVLPVLNGIDATKRILSSLPQTKIVVLSACGTSEHVYLALRAGVHGYVMKDAAGAELVNALRTVLSGKRYLSASVTEAFANDGPNQAAGSSPLERLSRREREVLHLTVEGHSWQADSNSVKTGSAARAIAYAENLPAVKADEAFLAGVLHDVGKVVFATRAAASTHDSAASEDLASQMQAHHAQVGAYLLGLWGFPNSIVEAVAFHHTPSRVAEKSLSLPGIIHIADRLVHQRCDNSLAKIDLEMEPDYLEGLGLDDCVSRWSAAIDTVDRLSAVA